MNLNITKTSINLNNKYQSCQLKSKVLKINTKNRSFYLKEESDKNKLSSMNSHNKQRNWTSHIKILRPSQMQSEKKLPKKIVQKLNSLMNLESRYSINFLVSVFWKIVRKNYTNKLISQPSNSKKLLIKFINFNDS